MARSPEVVLEAPESGFRVALANFEGPFDLLLSLIAKQQVDITEIALSAVTDEFLSYLHGIDTLAGLDRASEFLVVAATLLDLKIAGLLPQGELVDAEDAALLEARDLLFARLLQYRAFKQVSAWFAGRIEVETTRHVRQVPLEEEFRAKKPELVWTLSAEDFSALAAFALAPREIPTVGLEHLHAPLISIREQAAYLVRVLRERTTATFRELIADAGEKGVIVARFIAVLELYRHAALAFEQPEPLGELTLQWVAESWSDANLAHLGADYDS
ncbi:MULTISPECIES: segregation and condensation protein A [unclassified Rathayibacter]|uniref:segregation and condensation protein A n=1 Tax=unclassified Rathayibacter TaxID=2609250 RepID=UPI0006F70A2D|nr:MULTISPECIES: ScpA family protein [unclassified Rathayibacter]KQQ01591.1 chromosome segregation protein ScpA [Rathayibacter sp. Leaf294]KQS11623.1 chromosome segregation protein ScpA [Rathayibacter sp. Leaf185]